MFGRADLPVGGSHSWPHSGAFYFLFPHGRCLQSGKGPAVFSLDGSMAAFAGRDPYVKSKATNQLLKEYHQHIGNNTAEIERLRKENTDIRQQLDGYTKEKAEANAVYLANLGKLFAGLDVPTDQIDDNSEPGSSLVASGAYGPRCKIAQMLAFVETQRALAPDMITFPVVIDSPNVLEQDSEHLDSVIHTIFTWDKTDNQIIVASIQGKETASKISDVNIITLENPQNHLFNSEEYALFESEISEIFTQF